jgi:DNA modification methylase
MTITCHFGDCREVLKTLPDESVHCVVTSPPYFGLRDYGTAQWEGGDPECEHLPENRGSRFATPVSAKQRSNTGSGTASNRDCSCGARRIDSQIGLEPTPDEYVAQMVTVFREVRRVLRKDGTAWLNLGDCYGGPKGDTRGALINPNRQNDYFGRAAGGSCFMGTTAKQLLGIPWRVAFALQADGWWLRQDIIWSKPNPMPESVTDRCTKAHEYIFLLSKSAKYYYDADAIAEEVSPNTHARISQDLANQIGTFRANGGAKTNGPLKAVVKGSTRKLTEVGSGIKNNDSFTNAVYLLTDKRNKRSVWEVATQSFSEAHFATFPPVLIEPCILAGCPKGGTVLDPFGGAGTTGLVADRLERNAILVELNKAYADMARNRIEQDAPLFVEFTSVARNATA